MSNTRRSNGGGPLRQEKYASSPEYERGLIANLVAKRCGLLERAEDRELVWFLHYISQDDCGLNRLASELCARFAERLATPVMQRLGTKPGQVYNAKQVAQVRVEIPDGTFDYLLKGENDLAALVALPDSPQDLVPDYDGEWQRQRDSKLAEIRAAAAKFPTQYEASRFVDRCRSAATEHLPRHLCDLCLDPASPIADGSPWYFPNLVSTLREYQTAWIARRRDAVAVTAITQQVADALEYARDSRRLVLVVGNPDIGASFTAKAWCEQNPGSVRYVQVPSTNDEIGFFREIAKSLGIASGLGWKAVQLRARIEDVLQSGQLTLVFDQAHFLFPTNDCRNTMPGRINWVQTALVNYNVGVALLSTPQFIKSLKVIERATAWNSAQLMAGVHFVKLPDTLSLDDLTAVAKSLLPNADPRCARALALHADDTGKGFAGIESVLERARFIARRAGRQELGLADVAKSLDEINSSNNALAEALQEAAKPRRGRAGNTPAQPLQPRFSAPEIAPQPSAATRGVTPSSERNRLAGLERTPG